MSQQERVSWVSLVVSVAVGYQYFSRVLALLGTGPLESMHIVQLLLFALMLAGLTVYASRILYYRRGA